MTKMNEAAVRAEVEREFSALRGKSEDELRAEVGELALGPDVLNADKDVTRQELIQAGEGIAKRRSLREVVCAPENRKSIGEALTIENVSSLVLLLLAVFNMTVVAVGIIALAVLLLKIGLNEYCRVESTA